MKDLMFHLLPSDTHALNATLAKVPVDGDTVRQLLEDFCRRVIETRMEQIDANKLIHAQLDRRIEVAVKSAAQKLEAEMVVAARAGLLARVRTAVEALPVKVEVGP